MAFYKVTDNQDDQFASDVNQYADGFGGNADVGQVKLFAPISPPGALTATVSQNTGNLTGNYQYVVAFLTGYWQGEPGTGNLLVQGNTGYGAASSTVSPSGQQVALSAIPTGPTGTVARIIGRTKTNAPGTFYFLAQIVDNTTLNWVDNTPDSGLGATLNQNNTTGSYLNLPNLNSLPLVGPNNTICIVNNQLYQSNGTTWVAMAPPITPANIASSTYAVDTGSANSYAVALTPEPTAYTAGMAISFKASNANTGSSTINVNGLGAIAIKKNAGINLQAGDILAGQIVNLEYDGAYFQLVPANLLPATSSTIGGIKVGNGVNVVNDGTVSVNVFQHLSYWL